MSNSRSAPGYTAAPATWSTTPGRPANGASNTMTAGGPASNHKRQISDFSYANVLPKKTCQRDEMEPKKPSYFFGNYNCSSFIMSSVGAPSPTVAPGRAGQSAEKSTGNVNKKSKKGPTNKDTSDATRVFSQLESITSRLDEEAAAGETWFANLTNQVLVPHIQEILDTVKEMERQRGIPETPEQAARFAALGYKPRSAQ
ncbi:hypothetical protein SEPCBS119000_005620 [Sporothrix epigloea]|uniref:Uncharacterized protein n=1 Tax=Sporothrix epigloea TaxID=1892477 RepID=A0ABP0E1K3_9PEZI